MLFWLVIKNKDQNLLILLEDTILLKFQKDHTYNK